MSNSAILGLLGLGAIAAGGALYANSQVANSNTTEKGDNVEISEGIRIFNSPFGVINVYDGCGCSDDKTETVSKRGDVSQTRTPNPNTTSDRYIVVNNREQTDIGLIRESVPNSIDRRNYMGRLEAALAAKNVSSGTYQVRVGSLDATPERALVDIAEGGDVIHEPQLNTFKEGENLRVSNTIYLVKEDESIREPLDANNNGYLGNPDVCVIPAGNGAPIAVIPGTDSYVHVTTGAGRGFRVEGDSELEQDMSSNRGIYLSLVDLGKKFGVGSGYNLGYGKLTQANATALNQNFKGLVGCIEDPNFDPRDDGAINQEDLNRGAAALGIYTAVNEFELGGGNPERLESLFREDGISQIGLAERYSAERTDYTGLRDTKKIEQLQERILAYNPTSAADMAERAYVLTMEELRGGNN